MTQENDSRYPWTYAVDLIRHFAGHDENGMNLGSRSDASHILHSIAKIIGEDEEEFAIKLADYFLDNSARLDVHMIRQLGLLSKN